MKRSAMLAFSDAHANLGPMKPSAMSDARATRQLFLAACTVAAGLVAGARDVGAQGTDGPFARWAGVVIAGDFHGAGGGDTEAFDNARRDVSDALVRRGFAADHLKQFSVRPERYPDVTPLRATQSEIRDTLLDLTYRAPEGCLFYITSHGTPMGITLGTAALSPRDISQMLDQTCGSVPTIVFISACYSGSYIPALQAANRMIMTAARYDRTSFGCGEGNKYPYFDECFLQAIPGSRGFPNLGANVQDCIAARERREGLKPPSEPQLRIGASVERLLAGAAFRKD